MTDATSITELTSMTEEQRRVRGWVESFIKGTTTREDAKALLVTTRRLQSTPYLDEMVMCARHAASLCPDDLDVLIALEEAIHLSGDWRDRQEVREKIALIKKTRTKQLRILGAGWLSNIGHIGHLDIYVKLQKLGRLPAEPATIIGWNNPNHPAIANVSYFNYYREYFKTTITDHDTYNNLSPIIDSISTNLGLGGWELNDGYFDLATVCSWTCEEWYRRKLPPLLELTQEDAERGRNMLQKMGLPSDAWFVSLHCRDADWRVTRAGPNADIDSYRAGMEAITRRGGWVIRMGNPRMKPISPPMPQVIDYAHSPYRCDWMDVFLWAACRFFIATSSGPLVIPYTFGRPVIHPNRVPMAYAIPEHPLTLSNPKLWWSDREKRLITLDEMFTTPLGWLHSREFLGLGGVRQVDNTPDDIADMVEEMLDRLDGRFIETDEYQRLHAYFDNLRIKHKAKINFRLGYAFMRKYESILSP